MKKKTTLQDMRDILVNSPDGSDRHFWGVVTRKNTNAAGKVTSYEVALGGNEGTMTCRKLAGADVGDTVMVTLQKNGAATVTGTVDGDKDAENALTAATEAQQTAEAIEDLVGDGDESGITVKTQYYLSTSNTTPTGGSWQDTLPTYVAGRYYWTKTITTYADGSEVESTPVLNVAAQISAETNAVATATDQHFWSDSSGAYVTKSNKDLSSGYATKVTTYGILQTYNGNNLMSLTSSGLTFYQSNGSTPMASYSSGGAYLYAGGSVVGSFTQSGVTVGGTSSGDANVYIHTSGNNTLYEFRNGTSTMGTIEGVYLGYFQFESSRGFRYLVGSTDVFGVSTTRVYSNLPTSIYSTLYVSGSISGDSLNISGNATVDKLYVTTPGTASSATANCRIATGESNRIMFTGSSSREIKHDIEPIKDDYIDPHRLYDAEVMQFVYNLDYLSKRDSRYNVTVPGFIAEDLQKAYPIAVDTENGKAVDWNERYIIPPMLALIQEQKKEIDSIRKELTDIKKLIA